MVSYDAFLSYSHAKDKPIAAALQSVVQTLGKPWYARRSLRVFRDDTSLSATPHLWPSIEQALGNSRFLILLASPEAATSPWVDKETSYWLAHNSVDKLLIALTDGALTWDRRDFCWSAATPLPASLKGKFPSEPKWVDLRAYREGASPRDARFMELAANFAAAVQGAPKEDLLSNEVRQQRRALTLAWSAVGLLLALVGAAGWQWSVAVGARKVAEIERNRAEKTLSAATETASRLVFDLAQQFRHAKGMPSALVKDILARAQGLLQQLEQGAESTPALRETRAAASDVVAQLLDALGDPDGALREADRALKLIEGVAAVDPTNIRWQHLLWVSDVRLADLTSEQADYGAALDYGRKSLAVAQSLRATDKDNASWQDDEAASYERIGDALTNRREFDEALRNYGCTLSIREGLVAKDGTKVEWRRNLSLVHQRLGDALLAAGREGAALDHFRKGLAIIEEVTAAIPANTQFQQDMAIFHERVGEILHGRGLEEEALGSYRTEVTIMKALVASDTDNSEWQRGLSVAYEHVGDLLRRGGKLDAALEDYGRSLAIRQKLTARNENNTVWRRDLALAFERVGNILRDQGKPSQALDNFSKTLAIELKLVTLNYDNTLWRRELAISYQRNGDALRALGRRAEALNNYRSSFAILTRLVGVDKTNVQWREDLWIGYRKLLAVLVELNEHDEASAYLDTTLLPEPVTAGNYLDRGIAKLLSTQPQAAADDFAAAHRLHPADPYLVIWLHLARMQGSQNDSEEFTGNTVRFDRGKWPWPIIAFFSGSKRIDEVQAAARGDPDQKIRAGQVCEAAFYLGAFELGRGANDRALPLLTAAVESCPAELPPYAPAKIEFKRLSDMKKAAVAK